MTPTPAPCSSATHTPATAEMTTPPATLADLLGSLELKDPADVLGCIREQLPKLLPAGSQDLETAAALVAMAAQCFYMLEYKPTLLPLLNYDGCEANWRAEAYNVDEEEDDISSDSRRWDDIEKEIEKTSALVYGLARWLNEHQGRNETQHRECEKLDREIEKLHRERQVA
jgi:hypothetical protein